MRSHSLTHTLKILPPFFKAVSTGEKTFEIRFNDRDFQIGDNVFLEEFSKKENKLTGRAVSAEVGFVYKGSEFGIREGYCVFSLLNVKREDDKDDEVYEEVEGNY